MGILLFPTSAERRLLEAVYAEGQTTVLVNGCLYMRWGGEDETAKRMAIVQLYEAGMGNQAELGKAFGVHINSVGLYPEIRRIYNYAGSGLAISRCSNR